ncbi:MAG: glycosyltransferase family 39 protein [bacterium]
MKENSTRGASIALFAILALCFLMRVGLTIEHSNSPLFEHLRIDEVSYHDWSTEVMEGRYFLDVVPNHGPGYPWVVGTLYRLFGQSMWTHRILNILCGTACVLFVFLIGLEITSRKAALLGALVFGLYWPLHIFEQRFLAASMFVLLGSAGLYTLMLAARKESWHLFAIAGAVLGYAALVRPTAVFLVGLFLAWLLLRAAWRKRPSLLLKAALLAGLAAVFIVPVSAKHQYISGEGFLVHINAGLNLYIGNNPEADGTPYARLTGAWEEIESLPVKQADIYDASSQDRFYAGKVLSYIKEKPLDFLSLQLRKAGLFLNREEVRATIDPEFHRSLFYLAWLPLPGFLVILALALPGVCALEPRKPGHQALLVYLGGLFAFTVATVMASRYRLPAVPALAALSAAGALLLAERLYRLAKFRGKLERKEKKRLLLLSILCLSGAGVALLPVAPEPGPSEELTYLGDAWRESGDAETAFEFYRKALQAEPGYSPAYIRIGDIYADADRLKDAARWYKKAVETKSRNSLAHFRLGFVYWRTGRPEKSVSEFNRTVELRPQWIPGLWQLALREWRTGMEDRAKKHLRTILKLRPAHMDARRLLDMVERGVKPPGPPRYDEDTGRVVSPLERGWRPEGKQ